MNAVRLGSYSIRSTFAGASCLRRLKSTMRYDFLWPPPRKRTVVRPLLLRPPDECLPSVSDLTGGPRCNPARSTMTSWRWLGVTGLKVLSAIVLSLQTRGHVDGVTLFERHDRALDRRLRADGAFEGLHLALADERVHVLDLHVEELLDRFLDL